MAGELLIQLFDIARFRAIRPALDELNAARTLGLESQAVLREAAASPVVGRDLGAFPGLLARILHHPELELRVFLLPGEVDEVIEGIIHVLCFENGAEFSLVTSVGPSWVVLDIELAVFGELDWFRATFVNPNAAASRLPYPRAGLEGCYDVLNREDVTRLAVGVRPLPADPIPPEVMARLNSWLTEYSRVSVPTLSEAVRDAAEGLARLAARALAREELTLAHTWLL